MSFTLRIIKDNDGKDITNERNLFGEQDFYEGWEEAGAKILNKDPFTALFFQTGSLLIVNDKSNSILGLKYLSSIIQDSGHIKFCCQMVYVGACG